MTPEQKSILRNSLLDLLDTSRVPTSIAYLCTALKSRAFRLDTPDVERELEYLISKGFVTLERDNVSTGLKRYQITSAGTDYIEAN